MVPRRLAVSSVGLVLLAATAGAGGAGDDAVGLVRVVVVVVGGVVVVVVDGGVVVVVDGGVVVVVVVVDVDGCSGGPMVPDSVMSSGPEQSGSSTSVTRVAVVVGLVRALGEDLRPSGVRRRSARRRRRRVALGTGGASDHARGENREPDRK